MKDKCPICGEPKLSESKTCRACYRSGINKQENNVNWKGGKPKCKGCGKILNDYTSSLCRECYQAQSKGENNPNWKGGKPKCKKCGAELSDYVSTHCRKCSNQLENNPNWKGGTVKHSAGYAQEKYSKHPNSNSRGYILQHRLVMSEYLGRSLTADELVHHIDGDKLNNNIGNLQLTTRQEHRYEHRGSRKFTEDQIQEIIQLYGDGLSSVKISEKFNTTPQTVLYWLKSNNVKVKSVGRGDY